MLKIIKIFFLSSLMLFGGCALSVRKDDDIEGGVKTYNSGNDSPKTVESTEIISFECEVSLYSVVLENESELEGRNYKFSAVLNNEKVDCSIKWRDRAGEGDKRTFTADLSFMTKIHQIVSKYDFAQYNGFISKVSGLPDMYGSFVSIEYASGEKIYAYNNQDVFIPFEAVEELVEVFSSYNK